MAQRTGRALKQDRAVQTRKKILDAAAAVFDQLGYARATIADIVQGSGMTKGALYFHFESKSAIATAVIDAQLEGMSGIPPHRLAIQRLIDTGYVLAYELREDPIQRGASRLAMEQGAEDLDTKRANELWLELVTGLLTEARENNELLTSVNIEELAWYIVAAFSGVQNMSQNYDGRMKLTSHLKVMWQYLLPSAVVPGTLAQLELDPDRGERLANSLSSSDS
ncbi:ScbR family autoregulator-binding transcription factor [Streptomyces sp. NPDC093589]|uniref:ScbR family autoregulator-binding transcription factor n=1 Tax=Streptomyces sp. NPDC093589 TaxID=3366043 RepID=UPI0037F9B651